VGRIKRLAAEQPIVAVEVVVKPVPVLNPAVAVPVDVGHVLGVVRVTPKIVQQPSIPLPLEILLGLYFIWRSYLTSCWTKYFYFSNND